MTRFAESARSAARTNRLETAPPVLASGSAEVLELVATGAPLAEVLTALVELIAYREFRPSPQEGETASGNARYGAYLLPRASEPRWADLAQASRPEAPAPASPYRATTSFRLPPARKSLSPCAISPCPHSVL